MRQQYVAILEGEPGSEYSVFVPDFPGFASAGDTQSEAYENTAEGLAGHIALMVEEGEDIAFADIARSDRDRAGYGRCRHFSCRCGGSR